MREFVIGSDQAGTKERGRQVLERMGRRFRRRGLAVDHVFAQGNPAEEILLAAERHRTDLIVMGSKGLTGLDRYLLGSVSRKVARHVLCSVLVVRRSVAKRESR